MKRIPLLIVAVASMVLSSLTFSIVSSAADVQTNSINEVATLRSEVARLKVENETLRKENQALRQALVAVSQQSPNAPTVTSKAPSAVAPAQEKSYWLTTSSGVRHNSSCRYYMNSKGRACRSNEGRACKFCGG